MARVTAGKSWVLSLCLCASAVHPSVAQTSFPMITHANPVAVQRGKTAEVVVEGPAVTLSTKVMLFKAIGVTPDFSA